MAKVTRLRRFALIEEYGEIRYVGVFVDGFYIVHEVDTMWSGYIRADQMQRFLKCRNDDRLELVFMDGEDCEWRPKEEESRKMIIGGKEVDRIEVFHGAEKVAVITDDKKTGAPGYRIEYKAGKTTTVKKCSDMDDAEFEEMANEFCNRYCEFQACENCPIDKYLEQ